MKRYLAGALLLLLLAVAAPLRAQLLLRRFLRAGAGALAACCLESILSALFAPVFV